MFSLQIVDSDAFLDLPLSAQALYFHLGMRADDDGILNNAKSIARNVGATNKDFDILVSSKFLMVFDNGVTVIKHWKVNNYIAKDRYRATAYTEVKNALKIKENGVYTTSDEVGRIQLVDTPYTQVSKEKNSEVKVSVDSTSLDVYIDRFEAFWKAYPKKVGRGNVQKWFRMKKPSQSLLDIMLRAIDTQKMSQQWQDPKFIPMPMTWLNQERWGDELPIQEEIVEQINNEKFEKSMEELIAEESAKAMQKLKEENKPTMTEEEAEEYWMSIGSIAASKGMK